MAEYTLLWVVIIVTGLLLSRALINLLRRF